MVICIVSDVLGKENNGTTITTMNLIEGMKKRGHEVRVICPDEDKRGKEGYYVTGTLDLGPLNGYVAKNGVVIGKANDTAMLPAIEGADVVHVMTPFLLARRATKLAVKRGIPVTAGFHCQAENFTTHIFLKNSPLANRLTYHNFYKSIYRHCQCIHYPSQFIRDEFERFVGQTNGRVISNGVRKEYIKRETKKPEEFADKFVMLFTGRYSKEKSHDVLIKGVHLSKHEKDIQLIFAGAGPTEKHLHQLSGDLLSNQPIFGFHSREELVDIINYADLYVHPAEIEIEAIACLEAITCGKVPLIADSPRSATRHFALTEDNLFNMNDPADLAQKIDYWIENPVMLKECGRKYLGYAERFKLENCMDKMEHLFVEAVLFAEAQELNMSEVAAHE